MRKYATAILVVGLLVVLVLAFTLVLAPAFHKRYVNALVQRYSNSPDRVTASKLIKLLDRQRESREQGDKILEALVTPWVAVRQAYGTDSPIYITTSLPFAVSFWHGLRSVEQVRAGSEVLRSWSGVGYNQVSGMPDPIEIKRGVTADGSVEDIAGTGVYHVVLRYTYELLTTEVMAPYEEHRAAKPLYVCSFEVPVSIRVVEPEASEKVALVSDKHLDSEIVGGFSIDVTMYRSPHVVSEHPLAENVAFRVAYRDQAGQSKPFEQFSVTARGGHARHSPGGKWTRPVPWDRLELEPGRHTGTLVLETDAELAYQDAAMKTVWDGTIELPVEFEIREAAE